MTVEKPKPKQLFRPITTGANSTINQSQLLAIICNSLKGREKSRVRGAIGFGLISHWLKNWRESFKPITMRSNRNRVITFDSPLKTALYTPGLTLNCRILGMPTKNAARLLRKPSSYSKGRPLYHSTSYSLGTKVFSDHFQND